MILGASSSAVDDLGDVAKRLATKPSAGVQSGPARRAGVLRCQPQSQTDLEAVTMIVTDQKTRDRSPYTLWVEAVLGGVLRIEDRLDG